MKKTDITSGISYIEVPEVDLRILCGCPENSIKFIMKKGLTPAVMINGFNLVSGPNAILLNDFSVINSHFLNFAEFPVLHHQYFQGASFNGTNEKIMIIGNEDKVDNQFNYIERGLYGLISKDEIIAVDIKDYIAEKFIAIGHHHRRHNNIFDIINRLYISGKTQIKDDLYIERISINKFEFTHLDKRITVDLNLERYSKGVGLPYSVNHKLIGFHDFSITTVGDGDGWNPEVPCMGSLITSKGKRFLVDSGPGAFDLIRHLGISPSEIEGVFVTHSHDDHFAGILTLLNSDSKIKFFSSSLVIASVSKKIEALLDITRDELKKFIDFIVLKEGQWTNIGEMEVKPYYSFHTIETNIFYFRSRNSNNEWKVYGHIADIISRKDLDSMIYNDKSGIIRHDWADAWFKHYLQHCDLKRIDSGGGVVHGDSNDFRNDTSTKIILSHLNHYVDTSVVSSFSPPTDFGHTEILIESDVDYLLEIAEEIINELSIYNNELISGSFSRNIILASPDTIVLAKGQKIKYTYLVLSGVLETGDGTDYKRKYVKGDILYSFNNEKKNIFDYVSNCYCYLLKIPFKIFTSYIKNLKIDSRFNLLRECSYFSYGFSFEKLLKLSHVMKYTRVKKGQNVIFDDCDFFIVGSGIIELFTAEILIRRFIKDEISVYQKSGENKFTAKENAIILQFRQKDIYGFTSLLWSVFEEVKKIETIVETTII